MGTKEDKLRELRERELYIERQLLKREWKDNFPLFAKHNLKIVDKNTKLVPFELNDCQMKLERIINRLREQGKPVKLIILKARQVGITTYFQGRMIFKCAQSENQTAYIIAHRADSTNNIFEKFKSMNNHLPEDIKPLQRASNAKELIYDRPTNYRGEEEGLNSTIKVQTAGSSGIGRSDTISFAHLSEFAFWPGTDENDPEVQLAGIIEAIPLNGDVELAIESTANGMNSFKNLWDNAVAGENDYTPVFFAWYDHDEYEVPFKNRDAKEKFYLELDDYEKWLFNDRKLSLEKIHWYRRKLREKNGNRSLMKQENPSSPEEAFIMSGSAVFNNEHVVQQIAFLQSKYEKNPYRQGYFRFTWNDPDTKDRIVRDSIEFIESETKNWVRLYDEPIAQRPYVIGGDTKGEGKDWYAGIVIDNTTEERVGALHMQVNHSHPYTHQMYCLGVYFNTALLGIEMNFNTGPIDELERLGYPNQYQRQRYDNYKRTYQERFGWKTTGTTRPIIIDNEIELVENHIELFNDIETLREMLTFMYDDRGRPDAISGKHDDLLMADMIANEIRGQQISGIIIKEEDFDLSILPEDYVADYWNAQKRGQEQELLRYWENIGLLDRLRENAAKNA